MTFDLIKYLTENSIPHSVSENGAIDIPGSLILRRNKYATSLPENLTVGGRLDLRGGTQITELPENLIVRGGLNLLSTQITTLPENLMVDGWLDLSDPQVSPDTEAAAVVVSDKHSQLPDCALLRTERATFTALVKCCCR
ncbi:hypothetical protein D8682_04890 [Buttiauxella sp. 3AFRM03]|uniref:hypothetical protein n=1 Tax=Buttiauxella sp. 3AFRM03 TaxID=2479367 RepID=UPI000EF79118|nr:hypothetical protein [Buttiauxella sp. 3AFRM03]AYN26391.1 hypothetical protein D8682_04890 [Buttiauxella sp. 3AFRM03]